MLRGRIYSIKNVNENITQVVIRKTRKKKAYFIAVTFFYNLSNSIRKFYQESDMIKVWYRLYSKPHEKTSGDVTYYTTIMAEKVLLIKRGSVKPLQLFDTENKPITNRFVLEDTGEEVRVHTMKSE